MVVDVCNPCAVEGYQAAGVDSAGKDVLGDENALVPKQNLVAPDSSVRQVLALAHALEPVVVRVWAMWSLEPLVYEHVGSVVVEFLALELAHGQAGRDELGIVPAGHGWRMRWERVRVGGASETERMQAELSVEVKVKRRQRMQKRGWAQGCGTEAGAQLQVGWRR